MHSHRIRPLSLTAVPLAVLLLAAWACVGTGSARAGDKDAKKDAHLRFHKTYEEALTEARIRNLPVFVTRHKDF